VPIKDPRNKMPSRGDSWAYLDEELCFNLWNETGDTGRAQKRIEEMGITNPDTGKSPSRPGVYIAALRWISKNIEDARQRIIAASPPPPPSSWAEDKLFYLLWVLERMQQSNVLGRRARERFNQEVIGFAESYLTQEEYQEFLDQYSSIVGESELQEMLT